MAGLPNRRLCVSVGPPLLARSPRPGLATLIRLPLMAVRPPVPPVPIRLLKELAVSTVPDEQKMSSAVEPALPRKFPATIVLRRARVPESREIPPPRSEEHTSELQ